MAAWGPLVDRPYVNCEIELGTGPRSEPLKGPHLQLRDRSALSADQIQGRGSPHYPVS